MKTRKDVFGQSLIEIIVALAVFSMISASALTLLLGSFTGLSRGGEQTRAESIAQEGIEAVRSIRDRAWNEIPYDQSDFEKAVGGWRFLGEGSQTLFDDFRRSVFFEDVCRNDARDLVACPGSFIDPHSKRASVSVRFPLRAGVENEITFNTLFTNWNSRDWTQTNWSAGSGAPLWVVPEQFDFSDGALSTRNEGELTLKNGNIQDGVFDIATLENVTFPFDDSENYTFDPRVIEVEDSFAQLLGSGARVEEGSTQNTGFDFNTRNWRYRDWEQSNGVNVQGRRAGWGGNPDGYVFISIPGTRNDVASGFWEQMLITTVDNPTTATLSLDWNVIIFSGALLRSYQLYAFVDDFSGPPVLGTEVWSSGEIRGNSTWASVPDIDVSQQLGRAGRYYVKIVARRITGFGFGNPGANVSGFDNVSLRWQKEFGPMYPGTGPDIYPKDSFVASNIVSWESFSETADKNGGEIYYQFSDDKGVTWKFWDGRSWSKVRREDDYNTASVVNDQINRFPVSTGEILPRAYLVGDSTQFVRLDSVSLGYRVGESFWTFEPWNVDGGEVTPFGVTPAEGGNPDGYAEITVPKGGGDEVGGFFSQPFEIHKNNVSPVLLDFDYRVVDFNGQPVSAYIQAFIDTANDAPNIKAGPQIDIIRESAWTSVSTIDITSLVKRSGQYFAKFSLWVKTAPGGGQNDTGPFTVAFDNIALNLQDGQYPTRGVLTSSAFDMGNASPVQVVEWDDDINACPDECFVQMQVSVAPNAGGVPGAWSEWLGAFGEGSFFTNALGTLVPASANGREWVRYRVFLNGDGRNTPIFYESRINYK